MLHWEVVGRAGAVARRLGQTEIAQHYLLVCGTALALAVAHRRSDDVDLFSARPQHRVNSGRLLHAVGGCGFVSVEVISRQADQIHLALDGVRTTILAYPFRFTYPPTEEGGVRVADPRDVALMKAYAVGRRAVARDYVDLAYVLDRGLVDLRDLIAQAKRVFAIEGEPRFSERLFLQQLVYTDDLEDAAGAVATIRASGWDFERVRSVLRHEVEAYVHQSLGAPPEEPGP